jgi:hypothetical protein
MSNDKKLIVCFLITKFDNETSLINFIDNYNKYNSGRNHELLICFKLINTDTIDRYKFFLKDLNYIEYIDINKFNDYDFGSYKRIAEKYLNYSILFLNSHSYPACDNWLLKLTKNFSNNTLIGTSASNESLLNSLQLKKFYKILSYLFNLFHLKRNFNSFPNPHIRTSSFLINTNEFLEYMENKKINSKIDTWKIESGKNSLTNYFKNKNFKFFIINSDGEKYTEKNWKFSETYCYSNQSKTIISDKHTRKYLSLNEKDRKVCQIKVWGNQLL